MSSINHPSHYSHGRIEVAVAMDVLGDPSQWLGHALKYACRASHKGKEVEDLRKAIWCAERAMELGASWPGGARPSQRRAVAHALCAGIDCNMGDGVHREARLLTVKFVVDLVMDAKALTYELVGAVQQLETVQQRDIGRSTQAGVQPIEGGLTEEAFAKFKRDMSLVERVATQSKNQVEGV